MTDKEYEDFTKWWKKRWLDSPRREVVEMYIDYLFEKAKEERE